MAKKQEISKKEFLELVTEQTKKWGFDKRDTHDYQEYAKSYYDCGGRNLKEFEESMTNMF